MGTVAISDIDPRFDGEYELDVENRLFNGWEAHLIKQVAGARLVEIQPALMAGDYDVVIAFALVALLRAEKITQAQAVPLADVLREAEVGKIRLNLGGEDDAVPPPSSADANVAQPSSGESSNGTGDVPTATIPTATGHPGSDGSATSAFTTSAT